MDGQVKEVAKEVVDKEAFENARTLTVKIKADGGLEWKVPQDMVISIYLLKHLEVVINRMYSGVLNDMISNNPKNKIIKPLETVK